MKPVRFYISQIYPPQEIKDCPIPFFEDKEISYQFAESNEANPVDNLKDKWAIGNFDCKGCSYKCEDAYVVASLPKILALKIFNIIDIPVTIGERITPRGKQNTSLFSQANLLGEGPLPLSTDEKNKIKPVDDILDVILDLSSTKTEIFIEEDGSINLINPDK